MQSWDLDLELLTPNLGSGYSEEFWFGGREVCMNKQTNKQTLFSFFPLKCNAMQLSEIKFNFVFSIQINLIFPSFVSPGAVFA